MSIIFILLILVWNQISGNYVIARYALFRVGNNEKMSTMNNESCVSCICEPMAGNCNEEFCMDPKSIHLCKNKTYQANTEFSAPATTFSLRNIGFIFKMFICMCVLYMFIIHASGDCFESRSTRRIHSSLNQILSDDGLPSTNSDDRSCVMPLNVNSGYDNDISDPPPSYDDTQITRTHVASPPVQGSDLNHVELSTSNYYDSVRLFLTSPIDEPPPSYDELPPPYDECFAIHHLKPTQVHNLPPSCGNDHNILYMTIPVDTIESARDSQETFVSETELLCTQV
ncbi:uncharacterized protein LOC132946514 [Metopolophium dirhodum]|uniref:uncharacterized protein LOC132946514 n=1 Tax=Metopolophium dirhodum TaxID=44670 RepID=UPI0029903F10|nr:uncharacterized protein LOC132946514 [Metopolophium dirhodum]